ncbi:MAG TPA: condensation domain-containing protein [Streptomyces sp.]|uniref:condensation domain-containing protein n=1 Tax=Streptomyces sp. TaxID=1931 RepID=UPI002CC1AFE3|nr:condensation domain-containing protein [Streptomyces sp.]HWU10183.1 condensation domain-containing protein [Streptomyces sp.]
MGGSQPDALASWNQRHRLLQTVTDAERGVFNPNHCVIAFNVEGSLDLAALDRAWRQLQLRHWVLLTSFGDDQQTWNLQQLAEPGALVVLARKAEASVDAGTAHPALHDVAAQPFDLHRGPLARMAVLETGPQQYQACLAMEHLISDGWSYDVMLRDLRALYAAETTGESAPLPDIAMTYPEYVAEQNAYLDTPAGRLARERVGQMLSEVGVFPEVELRGFSGTCVRHERTARFTGRVDPDLYGHLTPASKTTRMTRLNLVLAALHASLGELSGRSIVGSTMTTANRSSARTRNTVGWFASKVIVPSRPDELNDLSAFLDSLSKGIIAAIGASKVPWPTQIYDLARPSFGYQAAVPFVTFNAKPARMRTSIPDDLFAGASSQRIKLRIGWQDAAIATYWDEHDGVDLAIDYKTDWYSCADVEVLWEHIVRHLKLLASAFAG